MSLAVLKTRCSLLQHSSTSWNRSTSSTPPSTSGEYGYLSDELCLCLFYCPHQDYLPWKLGVIFSPPFGTDIWGSTTSVTFDASGHLSDQWVWPSVWSVSVAICLITESGLLFCIGHLEAPYEYSFALRYKKLFKSLSNYFSVIRGLHLHHLRSTFLSFHWMCGSFHGISGTTVTLAQSMASAWAASLTSRWSGARSTQRGARRRCFFTRWLAKSTSPSKSTVWFSLILPDLLLLQVLRFLFLFPFFLGGASFFLPTPVFLLLFSFSFTVNFYSILHPGCSSACRLYIILNPLSSKISCQVRQYTSLWDITNW